MRCTKRNKHTTRQKVLLYSCVARYLSILHKVKILCTRNGNFSTWYTHLYPIWRVYCILSEIQPHGKVLIPLTQKINFIFLTCQTLISIMKYLMIKLSGAFVVKMRSISTKDANPSKLEQKYGNFAVRRVARLRRFFHLCV